MKKYSKKNVITILLLFQFIYIAAVLYMKNDFLYKELNVCSFDVFIYVSTDIFLAIIFAPMYIFLINSLFDDGISYNYVLKKRSFTNVFIDRCKILICFDALFSLYHCLSIFLWCKLLGVKFFTWKNTTSVLLLYTRKNYTGELKILILKCFLYEFLIILLISMLTIFSNWFINKIFPSVFVIIYGCLEFRVTKLGFLGKIYYKYANFRFDYKEKDMFITIAFATIIIFLLGIILSTRKELPNDL